VGSSRAETTSRCWGVTGTLVASMLSMPSPGSRRLLRVGLVAVTVLLLLVAGAVAFVLLHAPGNVSHPNLSFTAPTTTTAAVPAPKKRVFVDDFEWPRYGFDAARTRFFPGAPHVHPPFRVGWRYEDYALLEFPPVIYQNTLYQLDDDGSIKAINKLNGHLIWQHKIGTLAAASPALGVGQHLIYVPILSKTRHSPGNGSLDAVSMKTGRVVWSHAVPSGTESSPMAWGDAVYFGDQSGTVYALRGRDGHVFWTYHASGAVKGGPALANGILYFGDYAGRAYALNANTGHQIWAVSTDGAHFGFGSGNFYSTPAVAFGRVYMGNTDGRVYSFAAHTGQLAWATATGAYVYASPAVADLPGIGPTVYIGSYDGNFYAFNAQSGAVRWRHRVGNRISGSATIVDGVVYFSALGSRTTSGLNARTGQQVFSFPDGAFNPVVCDDGAIYLSGYSMLYQLLPKRPAAHAAAANAGHRAARRAKARATRHARHKSHN
jgi:outer membrane protein assembly factor BamB